MMLEHSNIMSSTGIIPGAFSLKVLFILSNEWFILSNAVPARCRLRRLHCNRLLGNISYGIIELHILQPLVQVCYVTRLYNWNPTELLGYQVSLIIR